MFILFPLRVDVPQERYPFVNWLIIAMTIGVFVIQVRDSTHHRVGPPSYARESARGASAQPQPTDGEREPLERVSPPGITGELMLSGWGLKGLLGYMWLHGGLLHLLGNLWFLWIFGNAVCAKVGNLAYLCLYICLGVAAGVTHLCFSSSPVLGASGAINGVVGVYLVLFFENEIDCFFLFWFLLFIVIRRFAVSSFWMILFWLSWDIFGAFVLSGNSNVGYFAHLGGFAAGFGVMLTLCCIGWVTMERYERSLVQWWQERHPKEDAADSLQKAYAQVGMAASQAEPTASPLMPVTEQKSDRSESASGDRTPIRQTCSCGNTLSVLWQYAGKAVRCPRCGKTVKIPGRPSASQAPGLKLADAAAAQNHPAGKYIRFACACGRRFKVPAIHAGRSGTCPQCGAKVTVPRSSTSQ